jgi:hypothetical protein
MSAGGGESILQQRKQAMRSWSREAGSFPSSGRIVANSDKSNPSWPPFVNEHTQDARWELQSLFKILRRPYNGS